MLKTHIHPGIYPHSGNVAHAVEIPAGARQLVGNGQVGTRPDGTTPEDIVAQTEVVFERLGLVLRSARMDYADIVRFTVYVTEREYLDAFKAVRDRHMGDHKPGATFLVVQGLGRPELKIEIEIIAAKVD